MDAAALAELRGAVGADAVQEHDPVALDGARPDVTLAPPGEEELARALGICTQRELPLLLRGGGSRLGIGNRPQAVAAWLTTAALSSACEVDADEGVAWVGAATSTTELDTAARSAGWRSPLEIVGTASTVGGALATGAAGPRALGLGRPRRAVLGLEVTLAGGERTRCGSRVVKNVSGYDLPKLYVGSFGTLGVLTGSWLRLRPRPEAEQTLAARVREGGFALAFAASRQPGARAAALVDGALAEGLAPGDGDLLLLDLAGDGPLVEDAEAWLRGEAEVTESPGVLDRLSALEADPATALLRFRIAAPPSALPEIRVRLREAGARVVLHPGLGEAVAFFDLEREDAALVDAAWRAVRGDSRPNLHAHGILERAPGWAKAGRDVFDAPAGTLPLMRALKNQFDPAAILNPGRFVGGL